MNLKLKKPIDQTGKQLAIALAGKPVEKHELGASAIAWAADMDALLKNKVAKNFDIVPFGAKGDRVILKAVDGKLYACGTTQNMGIESVEWLAHKWVDALTAVQDAAMGLSEHSRNVHIRGVMMKAEALDFMVVDVKAMREVATACLAAIKQTHMEMEEKRLTVITEEMNRAEFKLENMADMIGGKLKKEGEICQEIPDIWICLNQDFVIEPRQSK